jgi:hypothetical protein
MHIPIRVQRCFLGLISLAVVIAATGLPFDCQETPRSGRSGQDAPASPASESQYPALTPAQMLEDFDALVRIISDVMPTTAANKAV